MNMIVFEQDQDSVLQKVLGNILNINLPLVSASSLEHVGKKMKHVMKIIHKIYLMYSSDSYQ